MVSSLGDWRYYIGQNRPRQHEFTETENHPSIHISIHPTNQPTIETKSMYTVGNAKKAQVKQEILSLLTEVEGP